jgi:hypothetical protein
MEEHPVLMHGLLPGNHPTRFPELGIHAENFCEGFDPIKGRKVRVAVVNNDKTS